MLFLSRQQPPVDVDAIIEGAHVPVVERALDPDVRATIGDVAGRRTIIVNRNYRVRSAGERRWILAEELGHVLLEHRLVDSTAPGTRVIGLFEAQRAIQEREARVFASELLMPLAEVSRRWYLILRERPVAGELSEGDQVRRLAREFGVTPSAMRIRLEQMKILR